MLGWDELRERYPWPDECPELGLDLNHGWCAGQVREYFKRFLSKDTRLIVECGSWLGLSTRYMMAEAPAARVICIDHWKGSAEHHRCGRPDVAKRLPILYEQFRRNMWDYRDRLIAMRLDIQDGIKELAELGIAPDLVFVDGSHDTQSVRKDTLACCKAFPNARIMGDDYCWKTVAAGLRLTGLKIEHNVVAWTVVR
jgi:hypothetical protein